MTLLFIFSGLPGTGKTTLSKALAQHRKALHLRIDTIEQRSRLVGIQDVGPLGYEIAYGIAQDNLELGLDVVADSVNSIAITRLAWQNVAAQAQSEFVNIEVICSDANEHQQRIDSRISDISGLKLPTWKDVQQREYELWRDQDPLITIDTAGRSPDDSMTELFDLLGLSTP